MDIRLTHETRGICLSALSGSAVTSGSYESGVLWLTNTQIVILDSIHLWCFAGVVTNNIECQRTALILACPTAPGCVGEVLGGVSAGSPHSLSSLVLPWGAAGFTGDLHSPDIESQTHKTQWVGKKPSGPSSPIPCPAQDTPKIKPCVWEINSLIRK